MSSSRVFAACRSLMAAASSASSTSASSSKKVAAKAVSAKTKAVSAKTKATTGGGTPSAFTKEHPVSPAMSNFLGVSEISRTSAVKKIWDYIKLHQLQNPADKREIMCDAKLKTIFDGRDKVGMLEIGKLLSTHFLKTK